MARVPTAPRPRAWTPPQARIDGDRLLKARQAEQRVMEAKAKVEAEAKRVEEMESQKLDEKVDDLREQLDRLTNDLPKLLPAGGGGKRMVAKVLARDFPDLNVFEGLAKADGNFVVADGTNWTVKGGEDARDALGLGTAAAEDVGYFATAAQGALADSALQSANIGSTVQAYNANLDEYAAVNPTAAGLALLDDADAAAQRATLGAAGTGVVNTFQALQTFTTASSGTTVVKLESTSADAIGGPQMDMVRNSASAAVNDGIAIIRARGMNSAASEITYSNINTTILDPTAGSEDGRLILQVPVAGAQTSALSIANGIIVGAPTGSYQGTGTVNATGYYLNGSALASTLFGVTPGATGLALLDDTTAAAARTTMGLGTAAVKNTGTSGDAVPLLNAANTWSESQILGLTVGAAGDRFEIQKIASPVSYATTKASFVIQHYEDNGGSDLANGTKVDNVLLHVTDRTQGVTTSSSNSSVIVGQGWRAYVDKQNDGSAHCFTATGVLGANGVDNAKAGANGYNELGGFQALLQNTGSSNGYISAVEVHVKDSADAGVNDYPTRMTGVAAGLAKYNASAEPSYNFHAINEGSTGSLDLDAILFADHRNNGAWKRGIDLYDDGSWDFSTLIAIQMKEANKIRWTDGTNHSEIYANANGKFVIDPAGAQVFLTEGGALATPGIAKDDDPNTGLLWNAADDFQIVAGGVARIRALNNNLQLALGAGALKTVTEGAADSGGAGFKLLRVPN